MVKKTFRCACCKRLRPRNPRVKVQYYCGETLCQQARKNKWQREREQSDPVYRVNKKESQRAWRNRNPTYWKQYRKQHPEYCERNRRLQLQRDRRKTNDKVPSDIHLAKMDTLTEYMNDDTNTYFLYPANEHLVKKDALTVKITPISTG